jgi:acetylornithine deacetylase
MKAGLAAALVACREAARRGLEVTVAAVADEEHSSLGVQEILRHVRADAIMKTGPVLTALADLSERLRGRVHPRLGHGFVHASIIDGGREESTIPDRCTLTVERRTLPGETVEAVERDIAELLDRCRAADPALRVSSRTTLARTGTGRMPPWSGSGSGITGRPGAGCRSGHGRRGRARRSRRARRGAAGR